MSFLFGRSETEIPVDETDVRALREVELYLEGVHLMLEKGRAAAARLAEQDPARFASIRNFFGIVNSGDVNFDQPMALESGLFGLERELKAAINPPQRS